jgi:hypothetical protein
MIKPIELTDKQTIQLTEMCLALVPNVEKVEFGEEYLNIYGDGIYNYVHWFEFCFRELTDRIADQFAKRIPSVSNNYACYMVRQKVAHEVDKANVVDLLYGMWKNPKDYTYIL